MHSRRILRRHSADAVSAERDEARVLTLALRSSPSLGERLGELKDMLLRRRDALSARRTNGSSRTKASTVPPSPVVVTVSSSAAATTASLRLARLGSTSSLASSMGTTATATPSPSTPLHIGSLSRQRFCGPRQEWTMNDCELRGTTLSFACEGREVAALDLGVCTSVCKADPDLCLPAFAIELHMCGDVQYLVAPDLNDFRVWLSVLQQAVAGR